MTMAGVHPAIILGLFGYLGYGSCHVAG